MLLKRNVLMNLIADWMRILIQYSLTNLCLLDTNTELNIIFPRFLRISEQKVWLVSSKLNWRYHWEAVLLLSLLLFVVAFWLCQLWHFLWLNIDGKQSISSEFFFMIDTFYIIKKRFIMTSCYIHGFWRTAL